MVRLFDTEHHDIEPLLPREQQKHPSPLLSRTLAEQHHVSRQSPQNQRAFLRVEFGQKLNIAHRPIEEVLGLGEIVELVAPSSIRHIAHPIAFFEKVAIDLAIE